MVDSIIKLKKLNKIDYNLKFACLGSFPPLEKSEKIFTKMFEAGFVEISFGIEVVEEKQRLLLDKGRSNWMDIVRAAANAGIATRAFLMLGHPNQDKNYYQRFLEVVGSREFVEIFDTIRLSLCILLCPAPDFGNIARKKDYFCQTLILIILNIMEGSLQTNRS